MHGLMCSFPTVKYLISLYTHTHTHTHTHTCAGSVEYKEGCREDAPKCLFQIQIPKTFLSLQDRVRETVASYRANERIPIMEEEEFRCVVCVCVCVLNLLSWDTRCTCRRHFKELFDDEEEMNEAVFYLNLQGTCTYVYTSHIMWC